MNHFFGWGKYVNIHPSPPKTSCLPFGIVLMHLYSTLVLKLLMVMHNQHNRSKFTPTLKLTVMVNDRRTIRLVNQFAYLYVCWFHFSVKMMSSWSWNSHSLTP